MITTSKFFTNIFCFLLQNYIKNTTLNTADFFSNLSPFFSHFSPLLFLHLGNDDPHQLWSAHELLMNTHMMHKWSVKTLNVNKKVELWKQRNICYIVTVSLELTTHSIISYICKELYFIFIYKWQYWKKIQ